MDDIRVPDEERIRLDKPNRSIGFYSGMGGFVCLQGQIDIFGYRGPQET